jgi:hypothetical protein
MFNSFIKDLKYICGGKGWKTPNILAIDIGGRNTWQSLGDSTHEY